MADKPTAITHIEHLSGGLRVRGVHEGVPSDILVPASHVDQIRKERGEQGLKDYLTQSLDGGRADRRYNPHTGELLRGD